MSPTQRARSKGQVTRCTTTLSSTVISCAKCRGLQRVPLPANQTERQSPGPALETVLLESRSQNQTAIAAQGDDRAGQTRRDQTARGAKAVLRHQPGRGTAWQVLRNQTAHETKTQQELRTHPNGDASSALWNQSQSSTRRSTSRLHPPQPKRAMERALEASAQALRWG
jgi:hypothetical protein